MIEYTNLVRFGFIRYSIRMNESDGFLSALDEALKQRKEFFLESVMPHLKDNFRSLHSSFQSIYNILLRKSLIKEDLYKFDKKLSEVTVPDESTFGESEKIDSLSVRMSDFENQLDFIDSYYQFDLDFLHMGRVKLLAGLLKYYKWENLSENSPNPNTRVLGEALGKIKQGSDNFSINLISDAQAQMAKNAKEITIILKDMAGFHREEYKYQVRSTVLPESGITKADDAMRIIKQRYPQLMAGKPFYPELIQEIINEDFEPDGDGLKAKLLDFLRVNEEKKTVKKEKQSFTSILLEAVRVLGTGSSHLEEAMRKLQEAQSLLGNKKMSFGEKFKRWLKQIGGKSEDRPLYDVEYFDTKTNTSRTEKLDYLKFMDQLAKRVKILAAAASKMSAGYQKLESASEEQILQFLSSNLEEVQLILRTLPALDTYFRSELSPQQRTLMRGIKVEIGAIKNSYIKANQKRHEYISKKEEMDQLRKLGIVTE